MISHLSAVGVVIVLCGRCAVSERIDLNGSLSAAIRRQRRFRDRHVRCVVPESPRPMLGRMKAEPMPA